MAQRRVGPGHDGHAAEISSAKGGENEERRGEIRWLEVASALLTFLRTLRVVSFNAHKATNSSGDTESLRRVSRLIFVKVHFNLSALSLACTEHAGSIEAPGELAVGSKRDHAAVTVNGSKLLVNHLVGGLLQREALVLHQRADLARNGVANEEFSNARAGDGAGLIRRVGAGADDGRVAHAA